ncbi:hypothetical protein QFZ96_006497 [Paraburkholderia youngii]
MREHGRRFAHIAEVDRADVQPFQQLRPSRKLGPFDRDAEWRKALFERAVRLQQYQGARGFLISDAKFFCMFIGGKCGGGEDRQRGGGQRCAYAGEKRTARQQRITGHENTRRKRI